MKRFTFVFIGLLISGALTVVSQEYTKSTVNVEFDINKYRVNKLYK